MNSNWSYSPETPNLGPIRRFLEPCDLEIWRMTLQNIRAPLLRFFKLCASFRSHLCFQLELQSGNAQSGSNSTNFRAVRPRNLMGWPCKTIGHLFYATSSFVHHFVAIGWIQTGVTVRKHPIWVKFNDFKSRATLKFDGWPCKTIGHLFYATPSFVHHFVVTGEFKLELQSRNAQFGSKSTIFLAVWPRNLTYDLEKQ